MPKRVAVTPQAFQKPTHEAAPFGIDYQGMLLKVLLDDMGFARPVKDFIKPTFFQNEVHSWAWGTALNYFDTYGTFPTLFLLIDQAGKLGSHAPVYQAALVKVRDGNVLDEKWLKDQTLEWIRRNAFMRAYHDARDLWNAGKRTEVYDAMREALQIVDNVSWEAVDRGWYNREEFVDRTTGAQDGRYGAPIGTGIPELDTILEGGTVPGFIGTWIAYPKVGKTTMLTNLGAVSARAYFENTLHVVLEGSRLMIERRYDAIFTDELYSNIKKGEIDSHKYSAAVSEIEHIRGKLCVRGFTDNWDTNILHVEEELKDLKRTYGWEPSMIIVDYGDLMRGRPKRGGYKSETDEQVNAFKDMKRLAARGFHIWTASQARRPKDDDFMDKPHLLYSKDIADAYAKVRVCDFIGSLNQTNQEREQGVMRVFAELYRDNAADQVITIGSDFQKMTFGKVPQGYHGNTGNPAQTTMKPLGYVQGTNGV